MVYIALCALILGIIFGQFVLDSTWHDLCSELADYVLYLLMFSVGISLGMNESIIEKIKNYNLTILLIPIGVIIGSVFGGFICSYIFDMNLVYSLSIGASMGWYSLSGVMLESLANAQIGTIAFLSSLMREFIAFMMIPVLIKYLNTYPKKYFNRIDMWNINWVEKIDKNVSFEKTKFEDKRTVLDKALMYYLRRTQGRKDTLGIKIIDRILKFLFR